MQVDKQKNSYSFSQRDLAVIQQVKAVFQEITRVVPAHPGLPPLWSKIPYIMFLYEEHKTTKSFWRAYRQLEDLLKTRDAHYNQSYIPKASGGTRNLLVPDWELRHHQSFIQKNILYRIPVSKYVCAYHKYRGLTDLAQPHIGHDCLIHLDIKDFFSSISEQMVFEALIKETGYPKTVAGFLSRLCCYKQYLPQGACTSPALSNICFKKCDAELAALAEQYNMVYTRYSDDIYLSGNNVNTSHIIQKASSIITNNGFRVNSDKTKVLGKHQAQKVTAIVVNDKMQVSREYRRKLRQELYYLKRFQGKAKDACAADNYLHYLYQMQGRIAFVLYIDPENKEFLDAKNVIDKLIHSYKYSAMPF